MTHKPTNRKSTLAMALERGRANQGKVQASAECFARIMRKVNEARQ